MPSISGLTREQIIALASRLEGTCDEVGHAFESTLDLDYDDFEPTDIEADLSEFIDRCEVCEWWFDVGDLDDYVCPDCMEKDGEDGD